MSLKFDGLSHEKQHVAHETLDACYVNIAQAE